MRTGFRIGDLELIWLNGGRFELDGGAMFGVVPKTLWEKKCPADAKNRIELALNSILIKTPGALVLVETGIGTKFDQKFRGIYCIEKDPGLLSSLSAAGFTPGEIDFVVNTHLHFDHCGGNTFRDEKGELLPSPRDIPLLKRPEHLSGLYMQISCRQSCIAQKNRTGQPRVPGTPATTPRRSASAWLP
jgi:glyoxylase-like metal-dependent hydrolase (beta-lactamase superfamily II)